MTIARLTFAGQIKRAEWRTVGDKQLCEVSICKKRRTKQGEEEAFDWYRINIWSPAEFQTPKLVKGNFIAGSGEFATSSYVSNKDQQKHTTLEVKCQSFDVEIDGNAAAEPAKPAAKKAAAPVEDDQSAPF